MIYTGSQSESLQLRSGKVPYTSDDIATSPDVGDRPGQKTLVLEHRRMPPDAMLAPFGHRDARCFTARARGVQRER